MKTVIVALTVLVLFTGAAQGERTSVEEILNAYVRDFRDDPASKAKSVTFGVKVKDKGSWTVIVDGESGVKLEKDMPEEPTFYYVTDFETLEKMHRGDMAVLTAMGRASASDSIPMDVGFMEGFSPGDTFLEEAIPLTFHFWTRGFPEIVEFGDESRTRVAHGANVTVLYYQKGFRSAWYQIQKGQHINAELEDQTNPFPTLVIFTNGEAESKIGGKYLTIKAGQSVLIPAGVTHEFWNNSKTPAEFIILMFGEGA